MKFKFNDKNLSIEKATADIIDKKLAEVEDDGDLVGVISSGEGFGKSTFAQILGSYISFKMKRPFTLDNIFFNTQDLMNVAETCPKHTVLILDESRAGLYSGDSNSKKNKKFTNFLSTCRSKNLIILLLIPSVHDMDKYVMRWRCNLWINMQKKQDKDGVYRRGFYSIMGIRKRKQFFKFLDTKYASIPNYLKIIRGSFSKKTPIDMKEYDKKKNQFTKNQFHELSEENNKNNLEFTEIELQTIKESLLLLRKQHKSSSKEYRRAERLCKKLNPLGKSQHATRNSSIYNKGEM